MSRMRNKLLAMLLCLTLMLTIIPAQAFAETTGLVTREQAVAELINAIGLGALNETVSDLSVFPDAAEISAEYQDELGIALTNGIIAAGQALNPKEPITRLDFVLILNRAIREFPAFLAPSAFADVPVAYLGEVNRLVRAGILRGYGNGNFGAGDYLTQEQLAVILDRIEALAYTRPQDDFFYSINYNWLISTKLPAGYSYYMSFNEVDASNSRKLMEVVAEIFKNKGTYKQGTKEQKMADFYSTIVDTESRNQQGIAPIKEYLELVDQANTVEELLDTMAKTEKDAGMNFLFTFSPSVDLKNSTRYALYGNGLSTYLPSVYLLMDNPQIAQFYQMFVAQLFMLAGDTQEQALQKAQNLYAFEVLLAQNTMSNEEANKIEKIYNPMSMDELAKLFPHVDLKAYIRNLGYESAKEAIILDVGLMKKTGELISDENLDILKTYAKYALIVGSAPYLTEDFRAVLDSFNQGFYGIAPASKEDVAFSQFSSVMSTYLGQAYVEKYFSDEAKKDVEGIIKEIVAAYEKRIEKLDWMSDATKQAAITKLKNIKAYVGYPEEWNDPLEGIEIKSYENGGSLLGNMMTINAIMAKEAKTLLDKPVEKTGWIVPPQTVNAFYDATKNAIFIPAGILQPPFYDVNASHEQNLGGIGAIIAHEITHAFDNNGAQFDKDGNMSNWWTETDYTVFQQKCQEVIELFDGIEIAPNAISNGNLTVSESVSDLGAMACILDIVKAMPNANYKELFESNARIWRMTATLQGYQFLATQDSHAANKLRVNQILRNFQEFYDTYNIQPNDPMYLAPEDRIAVW